MESYKVIHHCSGCGDKAYYRNTNNFRVNANGSKIDVWLIYQCEVCKQTLNLSIHERVQVNRIPSYFYDKFMKNDSQLCYEYGLDKGMFSRNKAEINEKNITYHLEAIDTPMSLMEKVEYMQGDIIIIENPYELKIRIDKLIASLLDVSRAKTKKLEESGRINVTRDNMNRVIQIWINEELE